MHKKRLAQCSTILSLAIIAFSALGSESVSRWSWQEANAEVNPKGDLIWKPHPFVFEKGASVRYIDFENGDDANSGETERAPWKHHPWDPKAVAKAAGGSGDTYVFKRGIMYRGQMLVKNAGGAGTPIRLTSDPAWGHGEAVLSGSERVTGWTKGANHKDIPEPVWKRPITFKARWRIGLRAR